MKIVIDLHRIGTVEPCLGGGLYVSHDVHSSSFSPTHAEEMKLPMRTAPNVGTRIATAILGRLKWREGG